jgi:hypothetical protein
LLPKKRLSSPPEQSRVARKIRHSCLQNVEGVTEDTTFMSFRETRRGRMFLDFQLRLFWKKLIWFLECQTRIFEGNKANISLPASSRLEDRKTVSAFPTPTLLEFRKAGSIFRPQISVEKED